MIGYVIRLRPEIRHDMTAPIFFVLSWILRFIAEFVHLVRRADLFPTTLCLILGFALYVQLEHDVLRPAGIPCLHLRILDRLPTLDRLYEMFHETPQLRNVNWEARKVVFRQRFTLNRNDPEAMRAHNALVLQLWSEQQRELVRSRRIGRRRAAHIRRQLEAVQRREVAKLNVVERQNEGRSSEDQPLSTFERLVVFLKVTLMIVVLNFLASFVFPVSNHVFYGMVYKTHKFGAMPTYLSLFFSYPMAFCSYHSVLFGYFWTWDPAHNNDNENRNRNRNRRHRRARRARAFYTRAIPKLNHATTATWGLLLSPREMRHVVCEWALLTRAALSVSLYVHFTNQAPFWEPGFEGRSKSKQRLPRPKTGMYRLQDARSHSLETVLQNREEQMHMKWVRKIRLPARRSNVRTIVEWLRVQVWRLQWLRVAEVFVGRI